MAKCLECSCDVKAASECPHDCEFCINYEPLDEEDEDDTVETLL